MRIKRDAIFPVLLAGTVLIAVALEMHAGPAQVQYAPSTSESGARDTVIYPAENYKARRVGNFEAVSIADSLLGGSDSIAFGEALLDTLPQLTARDTLIPPDSLKETDPFRYKYYVALIDPPTHRFVSDSLRAAGDSLALIEVVQLDSIYVADSLYRAKIAFEKWYASLDKDARKKYDNEQKQALKRKRADSLRIVKEDKQAIKDSIIKNTPRILDTYALPDSMHYKRIIAWTEDRDFGALKPFVPDTSYNYHFYDYEFLRKDVNATWLGVAGSPVQQYNFFLRPESGTGFWNSYSAWSYSPSDFKQYNSKTPHTELGYFGTLMAGDQKESDNLHFFTTQNVTPEFNFQILFDKWGGGGILANEETNNKTLAVGANYLGKKYMMNAGIINNNIKMGENGGIVDINEIRDTTIEAREVKVANMSAKSETKRTTFYLDQQLRIPFNFINNWRKAKDSTYVAKDDITTAFVGHAFEYSTYRRKYTESNLEDSLNRTAVDNKIYLRLQPWTSESVISKIDVGIGDEYDKYLNVTAVDTTTVSENTLYAYAGASGSLGRNVQWNAKAHYSFAGASAGDFDLSGNLSSKFYPFRKAKTSPVSLDFGVSTSILRPEFYQRHFYSTINESMRWDKDLLNVNISKAEASLAIPHWDLSMDFGYAVLGNYAYYNTLGQLDQNLGAPVQVLSANLRKDIVIAKMLHLDNRILAQYSSNQSVLPLPALALNLKYFLQFPVEPGVMDMQIGVNAWFNTKWYSPQWNVHTGTFTNQDEWQYNNGPFFDVFVNVQWKTCCIYVKAQNLGSGWPMDHSDYFSAHRHIVTTGLMPSLKIGIFWPFYISPVQNRPADR